jgi:dolichol-phosphate mannosyltransferase
MRTLVAIPTYNERENLPLLVEAIKNVDREVDVLIIDDNSPDGTGQVADEIASTDPRIRVLHRPEKLGLGTAYVSGFRHALANRYDRVVEMDADFSHRPVDLSRLLEAAATADLVIGSRNVRGGKVVGWSPLRRMISRGGSLYARLVLGIPVRDCTGGFKCLTRRALSHLDLDLLQSNGYAFQVEVNYACYRAGMRIVEVPIVFPDRVRGKSKMSLQIMIEAALLVLRLRLGITRPAISVLSPTASQKG